MRAIDALLASPRAAVTHGTALPGSVDGARFSVSCQNWRRPGAGAQAFQAGNPKDRLAWAAYTFRSAERRRVRVELGVSRARGAKIAAYWDGRLLGVVDAPGGSSRPAFDDVDVPPGIHGLIVRAAAGAFDLHAVQVSETRRSTRAPGAAPKP